eukprot:MONOS_1287.1-p1 / transcript=MONOS_1287.1 / gene=MONOS_1287 / organism=Monocercomonoides_exilis_PA203 / gene_product=ATP-dependent RNA helicase / transcript_product=ATP-dependent RNA helicase / location=Mono_scaffold00022:59579-61675(-) / protein_length=585 / sequence_SO=supercontig / SO=protein_coding / is_pseudo=false
MFHYKCHSHPVGKNLKETIPHILKGKDVIGCAKTGSGKTAAFALPILQKLAQEPFGIFALIITPTRELASQIADQFRAFGASLSVRICLAIGGNNISEQFNDLQKAPHIVVATPARLSSFIKSPAGGDLVKENLQRIRFLVLDEADSLLTEEFSDDLTTIFNACGSNRQTLFFSATVSDQFLKDLKKWKITKKKEIMLFTEQGEDEEMKLVKKLDERYMFVPAGSKENYLYFLLKYILHAYHDDVQTQSKPGGEKKRTSFFAPKEDMIRKSKAFLGKSSQQSSSSESSPSSAPPLPPAISDFSPSMGDQALIFVNKKRTAVFLSFFLRELHIKALALHSGLTQFQRESTLTRFKQNRISFLIATDVAGRGLDIANVRLVINYDLPLEPADFIHRVGRTARAGRKGAAISFVTPFVVEKLQNIEKETGKVMENFGEVDDHYISEDLKAVETARAVAGLKFNDSAFGKKYNEEREALITKIKSEKSKEKKLEKGDARIKTTIDTETEKGAKVLQLMNIASKHNSKKRKLAKAFNESEEMDEIEIPMKRKHNQISEISDGKKHSEENDDSSSSKHLKQGANKKLFVKR